LRLSREPDIGEQAVVEPCQRRALTRERAPPCSTHTGSPAEMEQLVPRDRVYSRLVVDEGQHLGISVRNSRSLNLVIRNEIKDRQIR
jgi:hypothetical protein